MRTLLSIAAVAASLATTLIPTSGDWPVPTPQQLAYGGHISALIHFGMATFFHDGDPGCDASNWNGCDSNGGCNSSDPRSFAPSDLNISNWIVSMQDIGATHAVMTAKHGCGFLQWPTNVTLPDGSPYTYHVAAGMPVAKMFAEQLAAAGIGHGFYYSLTNNFYLNARSHNVQPPGTLLPGQASVTQQQYEDLSIALLTEVWTQFGAMTEIWLDGGCGSLCDRVSALLQRLPNAKNAVAFNGGGGTSVNGVRWCGTEGGNPSGWPTVWSTAACGWCPDGSGSGDAPNATAAAWYPSGVDFTLQLGDRWFYMPGVSIHPLADLVQVYHKSVGANGHLEIDFAIDRRGQIDPVHAAGYAAFGAWIRACYGTPVAQGSLAAGAAAVVLPLPGGAGGASVDRVSLAEDQSRGQFVVAYTVEAQVAGAWVPFSAGVTIGSKRIDVAAAAVTATALRLTVVSAFAPGHNGVTIAAFAPEGCVVSE